MARAMVGIWVAALLGAAGCGGSQTPAAEAPHPMDEEQAFMDQPMGESESNEPTRADLREQEQAKQAQADKEPVKVEFKEGMSVEEAISAVPPNVDRLNIEQDVLAEPLQDMKVYEPCKPAPSQRVEIRVAVWEGKAVGIDVNTTPKNEKLASCIKDQIAQLTWKESVASLNTIQFGF
ncbi:MAG TPA: hypothetical protein VKZ49_05850 [Polyangiaceae bacterium]|nr:hypothetical protein [Polyangiaceae bacterium]